MSREQAKSPNLHEITGLLFEAAAVTEDWHTPLDRLHPAFNAMAAHYFVWNKTHDRPVSSHGSTSYLGQRQALRHYLRLDPRRVMLAHQPVGSTLLCQEHFDESFVARSDYFQNYSLRFGRRYLMATNLFQSGPDCAVFALMRSKREGPFGPTEHALLESMRPDLERMARMHAHSLKSQHNVALGQDLLDSLPTCMVVTDRLGHVVRLNKAAEELLAEGKVLRVASGRLAAQVPSQTDVLHQLIRQAASPDDENGDACCATVDDDAGGKHAVIVTSSGRRTAALTGSLNSLALVTIKSLEPRMESGLRLMRMFGLTIAEAKLAAEVAAGKRLDVLAKEHRVRMPTLRTQMRAIYSKTGTSRLPELVHLVSNLPQAVS